MNDQTRAIRFAKRLVLFFWICMLLFSGLPLSVDAEEDQTVRVGYMLMEGFQEGQPGEVKSGYGYEYLQMLRSYTGWNYDYVYGTWDELVKMLERGDIDLLSHVARTTEREKTMLFSLEPQGNQSHYLFTCASQTDITASDFSTLNGKIVGVIRGDPRKIFFEAWCREHNLSCTIREYDGFEYLHADLHDGEIDAISASRTTILGYPGDWKSLIRFEDTPVYFAVTPTRADLLEEINAAQKEILNINPYYGDELMHRYLLSASPSLPTLTEEEQAWLDEHSVHKLGYCEDRRPLAYTDENGNLSGLLADYLSIMRGTYGIRITTHAYRDGVSLLNALQNGEVDIIAPVGYTYGMAERSDVAITNPMLEDAMLAIFKGYQGTDRKDIYRRIAVLKNSVTEKDYVMRYYPDAIMIEADSVATALKYVENGVADSYMVRSSAYSWYKTIYPLIHELQIANLPDNSNVNMAIRTADIALLPILNKGISLLDSTDITSALVAHSAVYEEVTWLSVIRENPITTVVVILAVCLTVASVFLLYRLQTESKYLRQLETAKNEAEHAKNEAEEASRAKSTFLTSMSHDIRTPMNAIIGMTTLASKHIGNPEYVKNCLGKVTLASDHLLTLINDVLDINKIETGKLALNPVVFSLADSIMNLTNIGRHQLEEKKHRFDIRIHNVHQEYLFADELRINQVFINLLSNAVKYTPPGGSITIDIKEEEIPQDHTKIRLIYVVEDSGIGMSADFQKHMYELFAMANKNNGTVTGSGVGLAICKQLIDLMNGTIHCESRPGRGTKFTVTLDLPIADRVTDELLLPPMKLLLVDDDAIFLTTASDTLRDLGLSPDCVDSGEKAVIIVEKKHSEQKDYPLIIIDWKMPGMDGLETTRAIRNIVGDDVSIIVISAYAPEEIGEAALAAGANGFINKPIFRSTAYQSIREILGMATDQVASADDAHSRVRGMHLLIAEDNDLNWEIARELLAMYDITVVRAENGEECIRILNQTIPRTFDAVLMDIQMPIMNGYDAAEAIRAHHRADVRTMPIVAMTADAYTEDVLRCAEVGMNAHIPKPIDMEKLLEVLGELRAE